MRKYILEEGPGLSDDYITEPEKMVWPKKEGEDDETKIEEHRDGDDAEQSSTDTSAP